MKALLTSLICSTFLFAAQAWAGETAAPADLPPAAVAGQVLADVPEVQAAMADLEAARAQRGQLKAGPYEYGLRVVGQRRNTRDGPDYAEWNATLERGLRLPGKAGLDARIGEEGVLEAKARLGDARHEAARRLLSAWYAVRQAGLEAAVWRKQVDLLTQQRRVVDLRVKRGDAARLDLLQADAGLAQAMSMRAVAEAKEQTALTELRARFPGLPMPDDSQAQPVPPSGDASTWLERALADNHELLMLRRAAEKARLQGQRAEADRLPDPTLGLYVADEQGGKDKIVGLSVGVSFPGAARRWQARADLAKAQSLADMEAAARRRLTATSEANWQRASAGVDSWRRLDEAAQAVARHADLAQKANELGELGLSEVLLARRSALEAELAAGQARLAANEAIARLMLDAHQLWSLEDDDGH